MSRKAATAIVPPLPVPRKPGAPTGNANAAKAVTLDAVITPTKCTTQQLEDWKAAAAAEGVPWAEWVRRATTLRAQFTAAQLESWSEYAKMCGITLGEWIARQCDRQ